MNRTQRRRTEALARRSVDRSEAIALAYEAISAIDDPDLAGGTQFLPDGTSMGCHQRLPMPAP